jgi:hypothetical protein
MPNEQTRDVPTTFEGKLEPNYYCRAWNEKRQKYCRARAGAKTDHPGVGRCRQHDGGGDAKLKHGRKRRYASVKSSRLRQLIAEHADDPNPLDLLPELAAARALFEEFLERGGEELEPETLAQSIALVDGVSRIVDRIERMRSSNALSLSELERLMFEMLRVVRHHVTDPAVCAKIEEGWLALRV